MTIPHLSAESLAWSYLKRSIETDISHAQKQLEHLSDPHEIGIAQGRIRALRKVISDVEPGDDPTASEDGDTVSLYP